MDIQNMLIKAIDEKKMINFIYDDKPIRKASPHAIYISSAGNKNLDAFQYEGFSKTGNLPSWRNFKLSKIENIEVLSEHFEIADGYKSESPKYRNFIHKI